MGVGGYSWVGGPPRFSPPQIVVVGGPPVVTGGFFN